MNTVSQEQLVSKYFQDLRDVHQTGGGVQEESHYAALVALLNGLGKPLKPRVRCILQVANSGAGKPDGGLFTADQWKHGDAHKPLLGLPQPPNRGVIEVKAVKDDAWLTTDTEQVSKYWKHYRQVLVTNYRDFVFVGQDTNGAPKILESYRLANSEKEFWQLAGKPNEFAQQHASLFVEFLLRVLLQAAPLAAPRDLAWFLASYARTARLRMEGQDLAGLATVRKALEDALGLQFVGDKGEHFFRSTFVQTLFYGTFSAWVLWSKEQTPTSDAKFNWHDTAWYLKVPVVQKLFHLMAAPGPLQALDLVETLDWATTALNRVDRVEFFAAFEDVHAVQYFYEPFLGGAGGRRVSAIDCEQSARNHDEWRKTR